jgi:serine/threonine protein kinase
MIDGLSYIHGRGYVHTDIKLENILVHSNSKHDLDLS